MTKSKQKEEFVANDAFFTALATATKLEKEFILSEFNDLLETIPKGPAQISNAVFQLTTSLKSHKRSPAIQCEGMILGITQPFDYQTGLKNKQMKELARLFEVYDSKVISQDMINSLIGMGYADPESNLESGIIWLDIKPKFNSGNANSNYGKPWLPPEETCIMNIEGFVKPSQPLDDGTELPFQKFNFSLSDAEFFQSRPGINNIDCLLNLQPFKQFNAKFIYNTEHKEFRMSSLTEFKFNDSELDILSICNSVLPEHVRTVSTLHEHYVKFGDSRDDFVIFKAGVQRIINKVSPIGNRKIYADDPTINPLDMFKDGELAEDTLIEVPEAIPITFARGSQILIVGKVSQRAKWIQKEGDVEAHNSTTEKELYVEAHSLYPIPGYIVPAKNADPIAPPGEGW